MLILRLVEKFVLHIFLFSSSFNNFIQTLGPETKQLITQSTGLNMFVPMDMAFTYVRNLPGVNIDGNITLKEMVCYVIDDQAPRL